VYWSATSRANSQSRKTAGECRHGKIEALDPSEGMLNRMPTAAHQPPNRNTITRLLSSARKPEVVGSVGADCHETAGAERHLPAVADKMLARWRPATGSGREAGSGGRAAIAGMTRKRDDHREHEHPSCRIGKICWSAT
jgi:hypothetical protein